MGPFGLPWSIASYYLVTVIGLPILVEIALRSKWWKEKSAYYFSFNDAKKNNKQ